MHFKVVSGLALAMAMTGCASVQLGGRGDDTAQSESNAIQREAMVVALERLEDQPWEESEAESKDAFVTVLFGGSGPSPKDEALAYLGSLDVSEEAMPSAVMRDVDQTLAAAWHMVTAGRAASVSMAPKASDVRMIEAAITEARHCRLVYAQAMTLMAKDGLDVDRDAVLAVKDDFTRAILELGRTADALTARIGTEQPQELAERPSMVMISSY